MNGTNVNSLVADNNVNKPKINNNKNSEFANNKKQESDNKTSNMVKYTTYGLAGLTAIGLATFAIISHKKVNFRNRVRDLTTKQTDLTQKISDLKSSIKGKYKSAYAAKAEELVKIKSQYSNKQIYAASDKDALDIHFNKPIEQYKSDMSELSKKTREIFKGKLVTGADGKQVYQGGLLEDKDYQEVRKLRKSYMREFDKDNFSHGDKLAIAPLIIKAKVTGKPIILNGKELPMDEALRLFRDPKVNVRKYFRENGYYKKGNKFTSDDLKNLPPFDRIDISNIDTDASDIINKYKNELPRLIRGRDQIPELRAKLHEVFVKLAQETRQSSEVKQLKELLAQLKTVSDELNTLKQQ